MQTFITILQALQAGVVPSSLTGAETIHL